MTIVIPEELVPLLRDGLYFDLHGQLEEAGALVEPRGRADISDGGRRLFSTCGGRAGATRSRGLDRPDRDAHGSSPTQAPKDG